MTNATRKIRGGARKRKDKLKSADLDLVPVHLTPPTNVEPSGTAGLFVCPKCGQDLYSEQMYKNHLLNEHDIISSPMSPESDYDETNPAHVIQNIEDLFPQEEWERMEYERILYKLGKTYNAIENAMKRFQKTRDGEPIQVKYSYLIYLLHKLHSNHKIKERDEEFVKNLDKYAKFIKRNLTVFERMTKNAYEREMADTQLASQGKRSKSPTSKLSPEKIVSRKTSKRK